MDLFRIGQTRLDRGEEAIGRVQIGCSSGQDCIISIRAIVVFFVAIICVIGELRLQVGWGVGNYARGIEGAVEKVGRGGLGVCLGKVEGVHQNGARRLGGGQRNRSKLFLVGVDSGCVVVLVEGCKADGGVEDWGRSVLDRLVVGVWYGCRLGRGQSGDALLRITGGNIQRGLLSCRVCNSVGGCLADQRLGIQRAQIAGIHLKNAVGGVLRLGHIGNRAVGSHQYLQHRLLDGGLRIGGEVRLDGRGLGLWIALADGVVIERQLRIGHLDRFILL